MIKGSVEVLIIGFIILAFDGKNRNFKDRYQGRGHIVLSTEGIAGSQHHVGTGRL